jgi:hypothetical protein
VTDPEEFIKNTNGNKDSKLQFIQTVREQAGIDLENHLERGYTSVFAHGIHGKRAEKGQGQRRKSKRIF